VKKPVSSFVSGVSASSWLSGRIPRLLALSALVLVCGCRYAYAQEYFEPCTNDAFPDYYAGVDNVIDRAIGEKPQLSLTTFPSFSPEYGMRIADSNVFFVTLKDSFWYSSNVYDKKTGSGYHDFTKPKVKAQLNSAPLSKDLIDRILKIYTAAISSSKKQDLFGFDGTTYRFTSPSVGCGKVWSPSKGTRAYQMVDLIQHLSKHARLSGDSALKSSAQLIEQKIIALEKQ